MKIVVDRTRCAGVGMCESVAPDLFEMNDVGELEVRSDDVPHGREDDVEQAVDSCPTQALSTQE